MTWAGVELFAADTLHDDFVEVENRDDHARDR
jgi:hypothetical protein